MTDGGSAILTIEGMSAAPPPPEAECELFGDFGVFIQVMLGIASIASLLLKRVFEENKRSWRIFILVSSSI